MQQNSQRAGISSEDDDLGSTPVLIAEFVLVLLFRYIHEEWGDIREFLLLR
jgi:hypothetical protein